MTERIVFWIILTASAATTIQGCVLWFKGRGARLVLASVPTVALALNGLVGDGHMVVRTTSIAIAIAVAGYGLLTVRNMLTLRNPTILFAGVTIVLIVVTEVLGDVVSGVPKPIIISLAGATAISGALFIGSTVWEIITVFRRLPRVPR